MGNDVYLITGGAGFIGSHLACRLKRCRETITVIALDNLKRRGSEFNLAKLKDHGVQFLHGDIRNREDIAAAGPFDVLIDCSAEPSVLAGYQGNAGYMVNTNLLGTINCLDLAQANDAGFVFLSTSRVYPMDTVNAIDCVETDTRFEIGPTQQIPGVSSRGISESFPLDGPRSLYGTTKLCSELMLREYVDAFGLRGVINRCGLITGPGQMARIDQGVVALWVARHVFNGRLDYIGFQGSGKQVRDMLHVEDLFSLVNRQLDRLDDISGEVYNIGGGAANALSLLELTRLCRETTGVSLPMGKIPENRPGDIRTFVTDARKAARRFSWKPEIGCPAIIRELSHWIRENEEMFRSI